MDPSAFPDIWLIRLSAHHGFADYVVEADRRESSAWRFSLQFVNDNRHIDLGVFADWYEGLDAAMEVAAVGVKRFDYNAHGLADPDRLTRRPKRSEHSADHPDVLDIGALGR